MPKPNKGPQLAVNDAGIYEIRWTEGRRSMRRSTHTKDRTHAQAALGRFLIGKSEQEKERPVTIGDLLDTYAREHVQRLCVDKTRQVCCIEVLKPYFGHLCPSDITPQVIACYERDRRAGKINGRTAGNGTMRRELNCLKAAINYGVRHRTITAADKPHIDLPDAPPPKDLWLSTEQLNRFVDLAQTMFAGDKLSRLYRFVMIAAETASRKSAVVTLKWNQVDLKNRLIHFQNDGLARTNKRRVPVPISDALYAVLKRAYAERTTEYVLDNPHSIQRHFEMLTARAGEGFEKVTPHTLRHTWATQAAQAGVPLFEIAGVLGDTVQTVMKVYAHHCPDHLRGAVNFRAQPARNAPEMPPTTTNTPSQVIVFKAG
jgi:integrase